MSFAELNILKSHIYFFKPHTVFLLVFRELCADL